MRSQRLPRQSFDGGTHRWTVSYSDFVTLLLAFFAGLYSIEVQRAAKTRTELRAAQSETPAPPETPTPSEPPPEPTAEPCPEHLPFVGPPWIEEQPAAPVQDTPEQLMLEQAVRALVREPAVAGRVHTSPDANSRGIRLSLGSSVLFEPAKRKVRKDAYETVAHIADALGRLDCEITVEGHTDDKAVLSRAFRSNWELSTARATEVLKRLVEVHGIDPVRLSAAGYGQYRPVATNATPEGRALNRRIDVVLSPKRHSP